MKNTHLILFILMAYLVSNCESKEPEDALIGKWVYEFPDNNIMLEFKTDGTYGVDTHSNDERPEEIIGVYKVKEGEVTMKDSLGMGACNQADQIGNYTFKVKEDTLYLQLIQDKCDGRKRLMMTKPFGLRMK
jgi:hypothetical protein